MTAPDPTAPAPRATRLEVVAGGRPAPAQAAALAAALELATRAAGPPPDPAPRAYRSRWRRAARTEAVRVPTGIKDNGSPWGNTA